jgi:hypothetical protein
VNSALAVERSEQVYHRVDAEFADVIVFLRVVESPDQSRNPTKPYGTQEQYGSISYIKGSSLKSTRSRSFRSKL